MAKKNPHFRQLINPIGEEKADLGLSFASRHFRIRVALSSGQLKTDYLCELLNAITRECDYILFVPSFLFFSPFSWFFHPDLFTCTCHAVNAVDVLPKVQLKVH